MNSQNKSAQKQSLPLALTEEEALKELVNDNNLIFVGSLMNLGTPPKYWAGYTSAFQTAKYKISRIIRGQYGAKEISVDHIVVSGSKTARSDDTPGLSPTLFSPNNELIIFALRTDSGDWRNYDETFGTLPHTEEWIQKVESAAGR